MRLKTNAQIMTIGIPSISNPPQRPLWRIESKDILQNLHVRHGNNTWISCTKKRRRSIDGGPTCFTHTRTTLIFGHYGTTIGVGTGMVRLIRVDQATVSWLASFIIWTSAFDSWFQGLVCTRLLPISISAAQRQSSAVCRGSCLPAL